MIKVKDGYAKLVGTTASGSASHILLSNGGVKAVSDFVEASALDNYLPLSGGTMNGVITMPINYQIQWGSSSMMIYGEDTNAIKIVAPLGLYVNSKEVWHSGNDGSGSGLDADLLDGKQPSDLNVASADMLAKTWKEDPNYTVTSNSVKIISNKKGTAGNYATGYSSGLSVISDYVGWQLMSDGGGIENPYFRRIQDTNVWRPWRQLAFIDDNVSSATKLQTTRTIWGQSFDGTGDISGHMTLTTGFDAGGVNMFLVTDNAYVGSIWYNSVWKGTTHSFDVNGSTAMTILNNGNVGIGTTNPSCKLDVNGSLKITDYIDIREPNTKNRFTAYVYSGIGRLYSYNDDTGYNDLYVGQNSTNAIVVKANGNVGIGTGSPAYKLDVSGDIATSLYLRIKAWSGYGSGSCDMWFDGNKTKLIMASGAVFGYNVDIEGTLHMTNDHKIFWHDDSANYYISSPNTATSAMLEYKAYGGHRFYGGNVGIGVESPEYKLHVAGNTWAAGFIKQDSSDDYVLLGGGGHKLLSELGISGGPYLPLSGGTLSGSSNQPLSLHNSNGSFIGLNMSSSIGDALHLGYWDTVNGIRLENRKANCGIGVDNGGNTFYYRNDGNNNLTINKLWHSGNDGHNSGLDADTLDGYHVTHFMSYIKGSGYVQANLLNSELWNVAGGNGYIEYYDNGTWFNSRWGLVLAISGFHRVGSSDSYVLLGGGGHKAVSDFAPVSHSHSYVSTGGMVNGAYAVIPTYNGETGWHRIATIDGGTGYGSWILYLCGDWSWASNTNAILHINTMHTTARITQVSGIVGYATDVRLVPISANNYYVDVYINYSGANTPGTVYCYFLGNGAITTRTTAEKITASVSTAASITLVTGTKTNDSSYAAHFYENSDIRYKTILNNLAIKANQLANLPLFDFKWLDNEDLLNTGTSAQAVQELLPYIVSGTDKLTLDYGVLGTIAGITACRELTEQEKEINELKEQIKFLKDEINNLKTNKLWQS